MCQQLNPNFTFDTFVVGACNRFAHGAALEISRRPGLGHPLFVYGGAGVGKTHLLHAIGTALLEQNPGMRVIMATSEQFTANMIDCIKNARMSTFSKHYRSADVLLIDDVQFFGNKGHTQEELTHTLNELETAQKQIVFSSDAPPTEIPGLIERLRSRFQGALLADIQGTDLETKLAILSRKAAAHSFTLSDEVRAYVALHTPPNVRVLEGALNRLRALSSIEGVDVTLNSAERALNGIVQPMREHYEFTRLQIMRAVAQEMQIPDVHFKGKGRSRKEVFAQHLTMYLLRDLRNDCLNTIGKACGGRHHSTVLNAVERIARLRRADAQVDAMIRRVMNRLEKATSP